MAGHDQGMPWEDRRQGTATLSGSGKDVLEEETMLSDDKEQDCKLGMSEARSHAQGLASAWPAGWGAILLLGVRVRECRGAQWFGGWRSVLLDACGCLEAVR